MAMMVLVRTPGHFRQNFGECHPVGVPAPARRHLLGRPYRAIFVAARPTRSHRGGVPGTPTPRRRPVPPKAAAAARFGDATASDVVVERSIDLEIQGQSSPRCCVRHIQRVFGGGAMSPAPRSQCLDTARRSLSEIELRRLRSLADGGCSIRRDETGARRRPSGIRRCASARVVRSRRRTTAPPPDACDGARWRATARDAADPQPIAAPRPRPGVRDRKSARAEDDAAPYRDWQRSTAPRRTPRGSNDRTERSSAGWDTSRQDTRDAAPRARGEPSLGRGRDETGYRPAHARRRAAASSARAAVVAALTAARAFAMLHAYRLVALRRRAASVAAHGRGGPVDGSSPLFRRSVGAATGIRNVRLTRWLRFPRGARSRVTRARSGATGLSFSNARSNARLRREMLRRRARRLPRQWIALVTHASRAPSRLTREVDLASAPAPAMSTVSARARSTLAVDDAAAPRPPARLVPCHVAAARRPSPRGAHIARRGRPRRARAGEATSRACRVARARRRAPRRRRARSCAAGRSAASTARHARRRAPSRGSRARAGTADAPRARRTYVDGVARRRLFRSLAETASEAETLRVRRARGGRRAPPSTPVGRALPSGRRPSTCATHRAEGLRSDAACSPPTRKPRIVTRVATGRRLPRDASPAIERTKRRLRLGLQRAVARGGRRRRAKKRVRVTPRAVCRAAPKSVECARAWRARRRTRRRGVRGARRAPSIEMMATTASRLAEHRGRNCARRRAALTKRIQFGGSPIHAGDHRDERGGRGEGLAGHLERHAAQSARRGRARVPARRRRRRRPTPASASASPVWSNVQRARVHPGHDSCVSRSSFASRNTPRRRRIRSGWTRRPSCDVATRRQALELEKDVDVGALDVHAAPPGRLDIAGYIARTPPRRTYDGFATSAFAARSRASLRSLTASLRLAEGAAGPPVARRKSAPRLMWRRVVGAEYPHFRRNRLTLRESPPPCRSVRWSAVSPRLVVVVWRRLPWSSMERLSASRPPRRWRGPRRSLLGVARARRDASSSPPRYAAGLTLLHGDARGASRWPRGRTGVVRHVLHPRIVLVVGRGPEVSRSSP